jgi:hypothetical protein
MINDAELMALFDKVGGEFRGQADDLADSFGMIILGRLYGWRVARLITPRRTWSIATKLFGDPKLLMPERGKHYKKSMGLAIVDKLGGYWDFIRQVKPMDLEDRKMLS